MIELSSGSSFHFEIVGTPLGATAMFAVVETDFDGVAAFTAIVSGLRPPKPNREKVGRPLTGGTDTIDFSLKLMALSLTICFGLSTSDDLGLSFAMKSLSAASVKTKLSFFCSFSSEGLGLGRSGIITLGGKGILGISFGGGIDLAGTTAGLAGLTDGNVKEGSSSF